MGSSVCALMTVITLSLKPRSRANAISCGVLFNGLLPWVGGGHLIPSISHLYQIGNSAALL
jgi:hypothetical protein